MLEAAVQDRSGPSLIRYTMDGTRFWCPIPDGRSRWEVVAESVGARLGCEAKVEDPPAYDATTRTWLLEVLLPRNGRRPKVLRLVVQWQ